MNWRQVGLQAAIGAALGGVGEGLAIAGRGGAAAAEGVAAAGARAEAANLAEQLTLKEAQAGAGERIMLGKIKDPRFPEDVFAKMSHVHKTPGGETIEIHYWEKVTTGERFGFKFKNP